LSSLGCKFEKSVDSVDGLDPLCSVLMAVAVDRVTSLANQLNLSGFLFEQHFKVAFDRVVSAYTSIVLDEVFEDGLARLELLVQKVDSLNLGLVLDEVVQKIVRNQVIHIVGW